MNNLTKNDFFQVISQPAKRKQDMSSTILQQERNSIEGSKLFDVKSNYRIKRCVKEGYCFDKLMLKV